MAEVIETAFGVRVDITLLKYDKSRRWLIEELIPYGIEFTDTKLSNRCKNVNSFSTEEEQAIEKVFKKHKMDF